MSSKVLMSVVATALTLTNAAAQEASKAIRIGVVLSQTGALADGFGIPAVEGATLAMDEINGRGGIGGRALSITTRDDRTSIQPTVLAFQEIVRDPEILAVLGPSTTGGAMAVRPIIIENKIPQLAFTYGEALTAKDYQYFYRIGPSLGTGNEALLSAVAKARGNGLKFASISVSDAGGTDGAKDAADRAPKFGMTAVANEKYKYGETDFTAQMARIKASGATVLLSLTQGAASNATVRAVKQLGMEAITIIGPNGLADAQSSSLAGDLLNGAVFWDYACFDDPSNTKVQAIRAAYEKRFNKPFSTAVVSGYDMIGMIAAALNSLNDDRKPLDREGLNEKLNIIDYQGLGSRYKFSSDWHNGPHLKDVAVCTYQGGRRTSFKP